MAMIETPSHIDILQFDATMGSVADGKPLINLSPEFIARVAAAGMGLTVYTSETGPDSVWAVAHAIEAAGKQLRSKV